MTNLISQKIKVGFLVIAMSSVVACGGGNNGVVAKVDDGAYKGKTNPIKLTSASNVIQYFNDANKMKNINPENTSGVNGAQLSMFNFNVSENAIPLPISLVEGPCQISGSKREEFSQNTKTGEMTIITTFNNCIETAGILEDGYQLIEYLNDSANPRNSKFSSTTKNYTYRDDVEHTITNGTVFVSGTSATGMTIKMNMVIEDKLINETSKFEDVYMTLRTDLNQESYTFSGKIYNSNQGYITIETPKPIVTINGDANPSSGVMRIIGASEVTDTNAIIEVIFQAGDTYTIKLDLDGDGVFEIDQSCNWSQPCDTAAAA